MTIIVKCIGVKDKKNPDNVVLKITFPLEKKGKIAFPIDFQPEVGKEYICEIVLEREKYCKVRLHICHFTDWYYYSHDIYLDDPLPTARVIFKRKCEICGKEERKEEVVQFPSNASVVELIRFYKEFLKKYNIVEDEDKIKRYIISLLYEYDAYGLTIKELTVRDTGAVLRELIKQHENEIEKILSELKHPYFKVIYYYEDSVTHEEYILARPLGRSEPIFAVYIDTWLGDSASKIALERANLVYCLAFMKVLLEKKATIEEMRSAIEKIEEQKEEIPKVYIMRIKVEGVGNLEIIAPIPYIKRVLVNNTEKPFKVLEVNERLVQFEQFRKLVEYVKKKRGYITTIKGTPVRIEFNIV